MGTAVLNPAVRSISGKMGNLVFYERNGSACVRTWVVPRDPKTEKQASARSAFAACVSAWRSMGPAERKTWNDRAIGKHFSGFNAFISVKKKKGRLTSFAR